jgi:D-alanyl-D-alanine carboxypeptidase/D-alanyl-D-alanine-endopeptidase (penicillin-binding protein 4)
MANIGGSSGALVVDLTTGQTLYSQAAGTPRLPASVEKVYTTSAALLRFGPSATLATSVRGVGTLGSDGTWHGTLFLVGGGDPTFGSAAFDRAMYGTGATMAHLVSNLISSTGITAVSGAIVGDESYFDSLRGTPPTGYRADIPDVEGELSALAYDRGFADSYGTAGQKRPALYAAQQLAAALRASGVSIPAGTPIYSRRAPTTAQPLAGVNSPSMATLIALTNAPSDNYFAEMLLKGIGARFGGAGTTAAGAAVVRATVAAQFGVHPRLVDGSGLSRADATSPAQIVTVLSQLANNRAFVDSLAVSGRTGTLKDLSHGTPAQGNCRGKTGTLHDVANQVGYCRARDGHTIVYAFMANAIGDPLYVHAVEANRMAPALASYNG